MREITPDALARRAQVLIRDLTDRSDLTDLTDLSLRDS
jgi:hypothetical protein